MRAISKSGSTVHAVFDAAAVPALSTAGNAGAPACVGCSDALPRVVVPSLTIACS